MRRRLISLLVSIVMIIGIMPLTAFADDANFAGSGTQDNPWLISTVEDLQKLAETVNNGKDYSGKYFEQTSDLDLTGVNWEPIGYTEGDDALPGYYFSGNYDGKNHYISNITSTGKADVSGQTTVGIFGCLIEGSVSNLHVKNADFSATGYGWGYATAGGIVGIALVSKITNCSVENSKISSKREPYNTNGAGGVAGYSAYSSFLNCSAANNTISSTCYAGGFIGEILDEGIDDISDSNFTNCYVAKSNIISSVKEASNGWSFAGGFVGWVNTDEATLNNCYTYNSSLSTEGTVATIVGVGAVVGGRYTNGSNYEAKIVLTNCYYGEINTDKNAYGAVEKSETEFTDETLKELLGSGFIQGANYPVLASAPVAVEVPKAVRYLVYIEKEQIGVEKASNAYTLTGDTATDAGDYEATATLAYGYKWSDNTTNPKTISWSINKAAQEAPSGLAGVIPTIVGGSDGKITGTTTEMEYSTDSAFTLTVDCADNETTDLSAGTYYVRYKESKNYYAGNPVTVVVGEGMPKTYALTVNGGTGSGEYEENVIVTIQANAAETGKQFNEWTGLDGVEFVDGTSKTSATAKFKMPAETVTATATYKDIEKHTVTAYGLYGDTMLNTPGTTYTADYAVGDMVDLQIGKRDGYTLKDLTLEGISESDLIWAAKGEEIVDRGISFAMPNNDVTITVNWTKNSTGDSKEDTSDPSYTGGSSSSGGGSSSSSKNDVTVDKKTENGKITIDKDSASKGSTVTITVTPDEGYEIDEIKVTDESGNEIKVIDKGNGKYTFTMPAKDVDIKVDFKAISDEEKEKTIITMQIGNTDVTVNEDVIKNDVAPVIRNDRTLVPIRIATETLGGKVDWNDATKEVTLNIDGKEIKMTIGVILEKYGVAPMIINDRTYVPIRFVADELGAEVQWNEETKTVTIIKDNR